MHSRREDDYGTRAPMAARSKEWGIQKAPSDYYGMPNHEVIGRSQPPRRSLSPSRRRAVDGGERRNDSFEERGLHRWAVRGETEDHRSHSGRLGRLDERPHIYYENHTHMDELRGRYDFVDRVVYRRNELDTDLKWSGYSSFRGDHDEDRVLGFAEHQLLNDRRGMLKHGILHRENYRQAELESSIRDAEDARLFSSSSRNSRNPVDGRFSGEQNQYPDPYLLEKLTALEQYERFRKEKLSAMERRGRYGKVEPRDDYCFEGSTSKDFYDIPQSEEYGGTHLRSSGMNISGSYQGDISSPIDFHPSSSTQDRVPYSYDEKQHRSRNFAKNNEDLRGCRRAEFSRPIYQGHQPYPGQCRENCDHSHMSVELPKRLHYHDEGGCYRETIGPNVEDITKHHLVRTDYSQSLNSGHASPDHPASQNRSASNYFQDDRSLPTRKQARIEFDRGNVMTEYDDKGFLEPEAPVFDMPAREHSSHGRISIVSEKDAFLVSDEESMRSPPHNQYEREMKEYDLRRKGFSSDNHYTSDLPQRSLKRKKPLVDEELTHYRTERYQPRRMKKLNGDDQQEKNGKWHFQEESDCLPSKSLNYSLHTNRISGRGVDHNGGSPSYKLSLPGDQSEYLQGYSSKQFNSEKRKSVGVPGYGSSNSFKLSYSNQRTHPSRNIWVREEDNKQLEGSAAEIWESEMMVGSSESELRDNFEDSEEFKERVQNFFLSFSKIINEKIGTRKRYKEQGRAGSLYCIVCGKSTSKEFVDTQRLAIHCYMSRKVGLRERHLGLHKAICVLLGWNSVVDHDVSTFIPLVLSSAEALAQKEDLILWPPTIIIHSPYMSARSSGEHNVFTKERVEDFLRGRGITIGKVKISPGISANNNVMVVKFLGTFPALQEAKNLHNYFVDEKRGRTELEQMTLSKSSRMEKILGDKLEEPLLYGYMGISEDLDIVDFDTKRRCSIKSKGEIEYLDEAPLTH